MRGLTGLGDPCHQDWRGLKVPIGVGDMGMAKIGGERGDMTRDGVGVLSAPLQRTDSECMAQIVDAGIPPVRLAAQTHCPCQTLEDAPNGVVTENFAFGGDEQCFGG
jgi:hypothetical protein